MDPNTQPSPQPMPIQDVAPAPTPALNPAAAIPVHQAPAAANPIAVAPQMPQAAPAQPPKQSLDNVLKDVSKDVKAASQKPPKTHKPMLAITAAILAALALSAAAYFAFQKSN